MNETLTPQQQTNVLQQVHKLITELCDLTLQRSTLDGKINQILLDLKQGVALVNNSIVKALQNIPAIDEADLKKAVAEEHVNGEASI